MILTGAPREEAPHGTYTPAGLPAYGFMSKRAASVGQEVRQANRSLLGQRRLLRWDAVRNRTTVSIRGPLGCALRNHSTAAGVDRAYLRGLTSQLAASWPGGLLFVGGALFEREGNTSLQVSKKRPRRAGWCGTSGGASPWPARSRSAAPPFTAPSGHRKAERWCVSSSPRRRIAGAATTRAAILARGWPTIRPVQNRRTRN